MKKQQYGFDSETGLPTMVAAESHHRVETVGIIVFFIGIALMLLGIVVSFVEPVTIKELIFKGGKDEQNFFKIVFDSFSILITSGPFTGGLGLFLTYLGLLWIRPDIAQKRSVQISFLVIGAVFVVMLFFIDSANAQPSCDELLAEERIAELDGLLAQLHEAKSPKYAECAQKFAEYLLERIRNALRQNDDAEAERLLQKLQAVQGLERFREIQQQRAELEETLEYRKQLLTFPVSARKYTVPKFLERFVQYYPATTLRIEQPFSIQANEVTVGEFRHYVESLESSEQSKLGIRWQQKSDQYPVENVTWQDARNYAAWLSRKTGWDIRLPTVQQWMAACVAYAEVEYAGRLNVDSGELDMRRNSQSVDHLLGNVREWSKSADCPSGCHRVVGENYITDEYDPEVIGKKNCVKSESRWNGLGFRVIRMEQ